MVRGLFVTCTLSKVLPLIQHTKRRSTFGCGGNHRQPQIWTLSTRSPTKNYAMYKAIMLVARRDGSFH